MDEAEALDRRAIGLDPEFYEAWNNLGVCLAWQGLTDQALVCFRRALTIEPGYENSAVVLAALLNRAGDYAGAAAVYQAALKNERDSRLVWALDDLAWLLATCPDARFRDGPRAVSLAREACELTHEAAPMPLHTLGAAEAETGRFADAIAAASRAEALASKQGMTGTALLDLKMIALFQTGQAYHEPPTAPAPARPGRPGTSLPAAGG